MKEKIWTPPPRYSSPGVPFGHQEIIYQFPRSSSVFTGESTTKRNNSTNILQNSKSLSGVCAWTRRNFLIKKQKQEACDIIPLRLRSQLGLKSKVAWVAVKLKITKGDKGLRSKCALSWT